MFYSCDKIFQQGITIKVPNRVNDFKVIGTVVEGRLGMLKKYMYILIGTAK